MASAETGAAPSFDERLYDDARLCGIQHRNERLYGEYRTPGSNSSWWSKRRIANLPQCSTVEVEPCMSEYMAETAAARWIVTSWLSGSCVGEPSDSPG